MTRYALLSGLAAVLASPGLAQADCYGVIDEGQGLIALPDYSVRAVSAEPGLMPAPPLPEAATGVLCDRETLVPAADDFEVLHHTALFIRAGMGAAEQVLALSFADGQYLVRVAYGQITQDQAEQILAAVEAFNEGEAALAAAMAADRMADEDGEAG